MSSAGRRNRVRGIRASDHTIGALVRVGRGLLDRFSGDSAGARIWAFIAFLGLAALTIYLVVLAHASAARQPVDVPWPVLSLAFFLAELKVVDVHFMR